ncbi:MAG: ion transporter [Thalassobaculaceae bacterium]
MTECQPLKYKINQLVDHSFFKKFIMGLIIVNAVILGLETSPKVMELVGRELRLFDQVVIVIFCIELGLRVYAKGLQFFRDPWGIFDLMVVAITLVPSNEALTVLRALRVVRVFRLVSTIPRLRRIVAALLHAVPGVGAIIVLLLIVFYVFSVITTKIFGQNFPDWFGSLGDSMFTLFQIMTLESWSMGIVRPVMEIYPWAWVLFVAFIVLSSFTVLNLFIAIIIDSMQTLNERKQNDEIGEMEVDKIYAVEEYNKELQIIRREIEDLKRLIIKQSR